MSIQNIVYIALFAAICSSLGAMPPIFLGCHPIPITAQSLGPMLAGSILGAKRGALAVMLFIAIMATGLPIMAGGRGGIGIILGPSAGFIVGFPIAAYIIGFLFERNWYKLRLGWAFVYILLGGVIALYSIGLLWITILFNLPTDKFCIAIGILLPGDIIKVLLSATTAIAIKKSYPLIKGKTKK